MSKEIERRGIPVALISAITPLPIAVGANRIIGGRAIPHPVGDPALDLGLGQQGLESRLVSHPASLSALLR